MPLKAVPHYLWQPLYDTPDLKIAEKEWCKQHNIPDKRKLFHYTTLQGMQSIIRNRCLWLSHVTSFNDPHEIEYGRQLVIEILNDLVRQEDKPSIRDFLSGILPFVESFGKQDHHAFVVCFCESENLLSQWREYADRGLGYSLGFEFSEATRFHSSLKDLDRGKPPYIRKVIYDSDKQTRFVKRYLQKTVSAVPEMIRAGADSATMGTQAVNVLLEMLLCFKHKAFKEEKEWRFLRVSFESFEPEEVSFRESAGLLVPYRPTYLFDVGAGEAATFPLRAIYSGPAVEPTRARAAIDLFLRNVACDSSPIKLVQSGVKILKPGFELR